MTKNAESHHTPITRRELLQVGCFAMGGLTLTDILRLRAAAAETGIGAPDTAVIFVTMGGGPSQFETYDPKPDAPAEYRGSFQSIPTRVAGVRFCELFPKQAGLMEHLAVVRSVHHRQASHIAEHIVETGYDLKNSANSRTGEMPSVGAVVSRVRGRNPSGIPSYVSLPRHHGYAGAHWLGAQHHYFAINDDPNSPAFQVSNLQISQKLSRDRLSERRRLLKQLDCGRGMSDLAGNADALDAFSQQAFDLVTGKKAQEAFDVSREDSRLRERYGRSTVGQRMLLARRLVEAGVPFVTVRTPGWDDHQKLAEKITRRAPAFDAGLAALIEDLRARELHRRVLVVAMGEFGRTPRVNVNAGRDHWPGVASVMLSGGSYHMGQVIGASDSKGSRPVAAPYPPQSVLTMVYRHLGIDPALTFSDYSGRPRFVLEERDPITELL